MVVEPSSDAARIKVERVDMGVGQLHEHAGERRRRQRGVRSARRRSRRSEAWETLAPRVASEAERLRP